MHPRLGFSIALLASFQIASLAQGGVTATTGAVVVIPAPASIVTGGLESDTQIDAFAEMQGTALAHAITLDITVPGTSPTATNQHLSTGSLPAGSLVNSYYLHFDDVGSSTTTAVALSGSITFDTDVIGLDVLSNTLNATDAFVGLASVTYDSADSARGLELVAGGVGIGPNDSITLSSDRRTVSFNLRDEGSSDDVRIITAVPEPSGALLFLVGGVGLLSALRLRRVTLAREH